MKQELLKKEVERVARHDLRSSNDFDQLCEQIYERTREQVSSTTLKRLWGYLRNEQVQARQRTLNTLSRYVGYRDYSHFCEQADSPERPQSGYIYDTIFRAGELSRGERLELTWLPDRKMVVEYLGSALFVILEAENTYLHVGDTFECHTFVQHEKLLLDRLTHDGEPQKPYVIGNIDGVVVYKWTEKDR